MVRTDEVCTGLVTRVVRSMVVCLVAKADGAERLDGLVRDLGGTVEGMTMMIFSRIHLHADDVRWPAKPGMGL